MLTTYLTTVCSFQEQISVSSPDFSDTDSNYTPPIQDVSRSLNNLYILFHIVENHIVKT